MGKFMTTSLVAGCGLATTVATALAVVILENESGIQLFSYGAYGGLLPIGALACGAAAASGYYGGSVIFHQRPTWLLLLQMVLIGALAQFLMYYLEYFITMKGAVGNWNAFVAWLDHDITSASYQINNRHGRDTITGPVGKMGYVISGIQFAGFMIGAGAIFFYLRSLPVCRDCEKYIKQIGQRDKLFESYTEAEAFCDETRIMPLDSAQYAERLAQANTTTGSRAGSYRIEIGLYECPGCQGKTIINQAYRNRNSEWRKVDDFGRMVSVPSGADLMPYFDKV